MLYISPMLYIAGYDSDVVYLCKEVGSIIISIHFGSGRIGYVFWKS